jgi:hypothetical protein
MRISVRTNIQQQSQGTWGRRVKKKHNRKGGGGDLLLFFQKQNLVHESLDAQDTVLCSYFAQRSGERGEGGRSRKSTVEEAFRGLDSFE